MKVSVVIATYGMDSIRDTHNSIDSVLSQKDGETEVIVVIDRNESLFNNLKTRYDDRIHLFESDKIGLSNARNLGVEKATGGVVAFIDDDAVASDGWVAAIRRGFSTNSKVAVVTGHITPKWMDEGMGWFPESLYWIVSCSYMPIKDMEAVATAIGTNMAIRKDVLVKMGNFHEKLGVVQSRKKVNGEWIQVGGDLVGEERDMCIRIAEAGYKIIHVSSMHVHHKVYPFRISLKNLMVRARKEGLTKAYLGRKHSGSALTLEKQYLFHAIKNLFSGERKIAEKIRGTVTLSIVIGSVGLGYFFGIINLNGKR